MEEPGRAPLAAVDDADDHPAALGLFLQHLRLPFQLLLAPIFLLGAWLSGAHRSWPILLAFLAVHGGIYGGMTAFNSYYDRDQGPIGFMKRVRPAPRPVRDLAIGIQLVAVGVLAAISPPAAACALLLVAMGIAYSHPRWRWKGNLGLSLAAVGIGQGILAFLIGYLITPGGATGATSVRALIPATGAALVTLGLYPITQAYQVDEDRARGDRTLPVVIGWRRALWFSAVVVPLGGALIALPLLSRIHPWWRGGFPILIAAYWALLRMWTARFTARTPAQNHDWAMGIAAAASAACWAFILIEWRRSGW